MYLIKCKWTLIVIEWLDEVMKKIFLNDVFN